MRVLSDIMLFATLTVLGLAAGTLGLHLTAAPPAAFLPPQPAGADRDTAAAAPSLGAAWPALFGTLPPEPEVFVAAAPEPEPEPEIRYDYLLTGLVAERGASWALISLDGRQQIVRVGDALDGGEIVTTIDAEGVWVDWDGLVQLIPVSRPDLSLMARDLEAEAAAVDPGTVAEVSVILERIDDDALAEVFSDAGSLVLTPRAGGGQSLDVVWIRQGALYERMGLRTGDKILRINGENVEESDLLAYVPDAIDKGGAVELEIERDGTRQVIRVNLGQG